ncbi:MAG: hypothetical protein V7L31_11345 [Nostoc sp.]
MSASITCSVFIEDFPNFVKKVLEIVPQNQATSYILERPFLAKYLRDGHHRAKTGKLYAKAETYIT